MTWKVKKDELETRTLYNGERCNDRVVIHLGQEGGLVIIGGDVGWYGGEVDRDEVRQLAAQLNHWLEHGEFDAGEKEAAK
jgi:hypothetical protein